MKKKYLIPIIILLINIIISREELIIDGIKQSYEDKDNLRKQQIELIKSRIDN